MVLASFGVAQPLSDLPSLLVVDRVEPFEIGDVVNDTLRLRICNDDTCFAPAGHTVVQAMLESSYDWWATRGARYSTEKDAVAEVALTQITRQLPAVSGAVRAVDVATPLTFWTSARSWRGAYEGWMPTGEMFLGPSRKTLPGLHRFFLAGQWVEAGGSVPTLPNGSEGDLEVPREPRRIAERRARKVCAEVGAQPTERAEIASQTRRRGDELVG